MRLRESRESRDRDEMVDVHREGCNCTRRTSATLRRPNRLAFAVQPKSRVSIEPSIPVRPQRPPSDRPRPPRQLLRRGAELGRLQDLYDCYYFVADWHALTSDYADPSQHPQATFDAVADWLAAGLDPEKSTIFVQSEVKEHAELHLLLSMVTPLPWLERVPTFKDQQAQLEDKDLNTYGFLGYPLLQTADIIVYRANFVPVGEDQASHLELSREIVRRFNNFYGDVFPEPQPLFTETPKVPGLDGRKMSKSYGNTIRLTASADEIRALVMTMFTDPEPHPPQGSGQSRHLQPLPVPQALLERRRRSRASITNAAPRRSAASTTRSCWPRS